MCEVFEGAERSERQQERHDVAQPHELIVRPLTVAVKFL
jgi:hypothetical protein